MSKKRVGVKLRNVKMSDSVNLVFVEDKESVVEHSVIWTVQLA